MFQITNITKGKPFGEYETRREADKAIRTYLISHDWDTDLYTISENGKIRSKIQHKRG
ncbi:MAG: hypothetical protein IKQ80_03050 [Clostridia bacterium]|nr:hypothetical protein [Clostridia bacterium]